MPKRSTLPASVGRYDLVTDLGWVAVWFGLATGLAYAAELLVRQQLLGQIVWHSREFVWMAPVAHLVLFLVAAMALTPFALITPSPRFPGLAAGLFAFLGTFALLLPFTQIARWAAGILALGVAVQSARRFAAPRRQWRGWVVRSAVVMAALVAAVGIGQRSWIVLRRGRAIGGLPAPARGAPNVLLLVLDTVREQNLGLYGYPRPTTPGLEHRAAESTVFDFAVASAPWTLPSHGTLFTGEIPSRIQGDFLHPVRPAGLTLAEILRSRGYRTAGFVANLLYTSYESGLARGFTEYDGYQISPHMVLLHSPLMQTAVARQLLASRSPTQAWQAVRRFSLDRNALPADDFRPASEIVNSFLRWQAGLAGRPFFAFLNFFDAHGPYRSPTEYRRRFSDVPGPEGRYDAAIAYLDAEVTRLLSELERRGVLDQTVVVVTSDHGELFGEHGLKGHANGLYSPLLRVPLLVRYPARVAAGVRIAEPVSLRDVPATVLDLTATGTGEPGLPGSSLASLLGGTPRVPSGSLVFSQVGQGVNVDSTFPNARTSLESVMNDQYLYIRSGAGAEELFDHAADPQESRNLADDPQYTAVRVRLRAALDSALHAGS